MTDDKIDLLDSDQVASMEAVLEEANAEPDAPIPTMPRPAPKSLHTLPSGYVDRRQGETYTELKVRELTGADEEKIVRVRELGNIFNYMVAIASAGLVSVGPKKGKDVLDDLVVGDLDYILLAVSQATFGEYAYMGDDYCEDCDDMHPIEYALSDVVVRYPEERERTFKVTLRDGSIATCSVPTVAAAKKYLGEEFETEAERNTAMLRECVISILKGGEDELPVGGYPSLVRELGIQDRKTILAAIAGRMVGPDLRNLTYVHECGKTIRVDLGLVPLFPIS